MRGSRHSLLPIGGEGQGWGGIAVMPFDVVVNALKAKFGADTFKTSEFRDNRRLIVPPPQLFALLEESQGRARFRHAL